MEKQKQAALAQINQVKEIRASKTKVEVPVRPRLRVSGSGNPRVNGVMRLALHNNLHAILEAQEKAAHREEATALAQEEQLRLQQLKTTSQINAFSSRVLAQGSAITWW